MGLGEENTAAHTRIIREALVRIKGEADLIRAANDQIRFWNTPDDVEPASTRRVDQAADAIAINAAAIGALLDQLGEDR